MSLISDENDARLLALNGDLPEEVLALTVADLSGSGHTGLDYRLRMFLDQDLDLVPDDVEIANGCSVLTPDTDADGLPDRFDLLLGLKAPDVDHDGRPSWLDGDSDGDTLPDAIEGGLDNDGDGLANFVDLDSDGNDILDLNEPGVSQGSPKDWDFDGVWDVYDIDDDADGLADIHDWELALEPIVEGPLGLGFTVYKSVVVVNGVTLDDYLIGGAQATLVGGPFSPDGQYRVLLPIAPNSTGLAAVAVEPNWMSANQLSVAIPQDVVSGSLRVVDLGNQRMTPEHTVLIFASGTPLIADSGTSQFTPGSVKVLTGFGFSVPGSGPPAVALGGAQVEVLSANQNTLVLSMPNDAASGQLQVITSTGVSPSRYMSSERTLTGNVLPGPGLQAPYSNYRVFAGLIGTPSPVSSNGSFGLTVLANGISLVMLADSAGEVSPRLGVVRASDASVELSLRSTVLALGHILGRMLHSDLAAEELLDALDNGLDRTGLVDTLESQFALKSDPLDELPQQFWAQLVSLVEESAASLAPLLMGPKAAGQPDVEITPQEQDDFQLMQDSNDPFNLLVINDSQLFASVQVIAKEDGSILRRHVGADLFDVNLIAPQGGFWSLWPFPFAASETKLGVPSGRDAAVEIITAGTAGGGSSPSSVIALVTCRTATGFTKVLLPVFQTVTNTTIGSSFDGPFLWALLLNLDSAGVQSAVAKFGAGQLLEGFQALWQIVWNDIQKGPTSLLITELGKKLGKNIPAATIKLIGKKVFMILQAAPIVDPLVALVDLGTTHPRLDFDVDYDLQVDWVTPEKFVNYHWGNTQEDVDLVIKGAGFFAESDQYAVEIGSELFTGAKVSMQGTRLDLRLTKADVERLPLGTPPLKVVLNPGLPNQVKSEELLVEVMNHPYLESLDPSAGKPGTSVRITGLGFYPNAAESNTVVFSAADGQQFPVGASSVSPDGHRLWVKVPAEAVNGPVYVTSPLPWGDVGISNELHFETETVIEITYVDNGNLKDDIFALFFDDTFIHTTQGPCWPAQTVQIATTGGRHRVTLVGIAAPDNIGTYGISFSSNVAVDDLGSDPLTGNDLVANAEKSFDIEVTGGSVQIQAPIGPMGRVFKAWTWQVESPFK